MRYALVILCSGLMFIGPDFLLQPHMPWLLKAFLHNFFHANIFHLAINMLVVWKLFPPERKGRISLLLLSLAAATASYAAALRPTIGMSDAIYAAIGLLTPAFSSPWWKKKETLLFLAITFLCIFVPNISATTHIAAFVLGTAYARIRDYIGKLKNDVRRAGRID